MEFGLNDNRIHSILPNHFDDIFLEKIIKLIDLNMELNAISIPIIPASLKVPIYPLHLGLLVKLRKALKRLVKRKIMIEPIDQDYSLTMYIVANMLTNNADILNHWSPNQLERAACLLEEKCKVLSGYLYTLLDVEPLYPPFTTQQLNTHCSHLNNNISNTNTNTNTTPLSNEHCVLFRKSYIDKVNQYHASVKRPNVNATEVFHENEVQSVTATIAIEEDDFNNDIELVTTLSNLSRERCIECGSNRQVYCGDCGGLRLTSTVGVLPDRVSLPFDVLLLVHWYLGYIYIYICICVSCEYLRSYIDVYMQMYIYHTHYIYI